MGTFTNHRHHPKPEELPEYNPQSSSSHNPNSNKKKWSNFVPILVGLVVVAEIAFLGRLDMAKNVDLVNSWAELFYRFTETTPFAWSVEDAGSGQGRGSDPDDGCEAWLEKEDSVPHSRDFKKDPIWVQGPDGVFV